MKKREKLSSRLGFILLSAGCAVGLGNVWRFPYVTGKYGGGAFVLMYLFFLIIFGVPIMTMEFAVGRASQRSIALSFNKLEPQGSKWHIYKYFGIAGNYLLMMFYTTIAGWMLSYVVKMIRGDFTGQSPEQIGDIFSSWISNTNGAVIGMVMAILIGFGVCALGLQNGVERITKILMSFLFVIMIALAIRALTLDSAIEGLKFYLVPDFNKMLSEGLSEAIFAAMGQSFFTLSIGIGSMAIFGSYITKERSLMGETINIALLDTMVAVIAGLIIFPACFAYGVAPNEGPGLVFVTLPNIFNSMPGGRIWGTLFFVFLSFAALSTIIAVFENILASVMDLTGWSRKKAVLVNIILIIVLSLPCVLGYGVLDSIQPLGAGSTVLDLEDFIVSNNILPLGSLIYLLFCVSKYGWGWDNFIKEANEGKGMKFPSWARGYVTYLIPILILFLFIQGYIAAFFS